MASSEHLSVLSRGVEAWNTFRSGFLKRQRIVPDFRRLTLEGADFSRIDFSGATLTEAYLFKVTLRGANLSGAHLRDADLTNSDLSGADLTNAKLTNARLSHVNFTRADLTDADLRGAYLPRARFNSAELKGADLRDAELSGAVFTDARLINTVLSGAKLAYAMLDDAYLVGTDLSDVNATGANLSGVNFRGVHLSGANFTKAIVYRTNFADVDLSRVTGLETVMHLGPSDVSLNTIYRSRGAIAEDFLRGCGLAEDFIIHMPSLVTAMRPIQFYSCFISYSSKDQKFAERLHADLQSRGVRVWFAPHDMQIGARIRSTIDEWIRVYDKLLLVLSSASVSSQWVEQEVETALRKERQPDTGTVLFPVRLDDSVLNISAGWPALIKDTRHIGDFTRWKEHDSYTEAFQRLMRDLKASG